MQPGNIHLLQGEVNAKLRRGIFYSIFWLMGVGSAIAVIEGFKAKRLIRQSGGELKGIGKVWLPLQRGSQRLACEFLF